MYSTQYAQRIYDVLNDVETTQKENIEKAASLIAGSLADDGVLHVFGSGHSAMIGQEISRRAGGLVPVNLVPDPSQGMAERLEGLAQILLDRYARTYGMEAGETMIVVSTSGRNPVPVEVALHAKSRGLNTIAITSVEYSKMAPSRHSSGQRLFEVVDVVLDNRVPAGDALVSLEQLGLSAGPASTMTGAFLANMLMLAVVERMIEDGHVPPILKSMNMDGADEHNERLAEKYRHRLVY